MIHERLCCRPADALTACCMMSRSSSLGSSQSVSNRSTNSLGPLNPVITARVRWLAHRPPSGVYAKSQWLLRGMFCFHVAWQIRLLSSPLGRLRVTSCDEDATHDMALELYACDCVLKLLIHVPLDHGLQFWPPGLVTEAFPALTRTSFHVLFLSALLRLRSRNLSTTHKEWLLDSRDFRRNHITTAY